MLLWYYKLNITRLDVAYDNLTDFVFCGNSYFKGIIRSYFISDEDIFSTYTFSRIQLKELRPEVPLHSSQL